MPAIARKSLGNGLADGAPNERVRQEVAVPTLLGQCVHFRGRRLPDERINSALALIFGFAWQPVSQVFHLIGFSRVDG